MYDVDDTIVALSTPPGPSGIGVVRLSGPAASSIARVIFRPRSGELIADRRMRLGRVVDPNSGETIDEALAVLFNAPQSYTCQDVAEIHCHGGPAVLAGVLELARRHGARQAEPGEFTMRAFINGRLDLAQAEAVAALIEAQTAGGARQAARQLGGALSEEVARMRDALVGRLAQLEAAIDFPEDELPLLDTQAAVDELERVRVRCDELARTFPAGRLLTHGARVAIVGRPNVGKSSLFNALLRRERALVHESPGTTRDVVEDRLLFDGIPATLCDTAGLRSDEQCSDPVERAGIERTRGNLEQADVVLAVFDLTQQIERDDLDLWRSLVDRPALAVLNKVDIANQDAAQQWRSEVDAPLAKATSAKTGLGVDELAHALGELICEAADVGTADAIVISARHADLVREAQSALIAAIEALSQDLAPEFAAFELRRAVRCLGSIIGRADSPDGAEQLEREVIERIFSTFCIGK
ncbi:MAG: tRNA uridine-5-carboxymethylaminomethyl(34) synthesis GTPase MnmE [Candidatus Alcyoniella australis]|nr:tRNA uridine-5-carboxymethylaminomethyl(34) synthesis GTPase MnmE [Candidatus Alcyoniella australis]